MKEELEIIAIQLKNWAKRYNKDYVSMAFVEDTVMANIDTKDKDYKELYISIKEEK